MKSKWLLLLIPALYTLIIFNRRDDWERSVFFWDKYGYYSYLPAIFIYNDLAHLSFYPETINRYQLTSLEWYCTIEIESTGRRLNKYAIGTSVFELPFFLASHAWAHIADYEEYPKDGFSFPYQAGAGFGCIFWVFVGLYYLRRFLLPYFSDAVVAITLLCIALGTNLYMYTAFDGGMSHPISFMLFCMVMYLTDKWYTINRSKYLYLLTLTLGFVTIVRPTNIVIAVIPLLWKADSFQALKERMLLFINKWKQVVIAAVLFILVLFIQLSYWKYVTGDWVYYSYGEEGFNFRHPKILRGLFGFRKGWFIYTPIAFLAMLGFITLWKKDKRFVPSILLYVLLGIYIVFSWTTWWYGGGFGSRATIEMLAVLALPLASLLAFIATKKLAVRITTGVVIVFFIALNMFQTYQCTQHVLMGDGMTAKYYWRVFGKLTVTEEDKKYLMTGEEIYLETVESKK